MKTKAGFIFIIYGFVHILIEGIMTDSVMEYFNALVKSYEQLGGGISPVLFIVFWCFGGIASLFIGGGILALSKD